MGLIERILDDSRRDGGGPPPVGRDSGERRERVVRSLLPVVLAMLASRTRTSIGGGTVPPWGRSGPGAVGGLGAVGDFGGPGSPGGLGALLALLARDGYGGQVDSWVGRGANEPLPPVAMVGALGPERIAEIAVRAGLREHETRRGLSELLPELVDDLTPDGCLPSEDELLLRLEAHRRDLPGRPDD